MAGLFCQTMDWGLSHPHRHPWFSALFTSIFSMLNEAGIMRNGCIECPYAVVICLTLYCMTRHGHGIMGIVSILTHFCEITINTYKTDSKIFDLIWLDAQNYPYTLQMFIWKCPNVHLKVHELCVKTNLFKNAFSPWRFGLMETISRQILLKESITTALSMAIALN